MTGSSVRIRLVALGLRDARRDRAKLIAWPRGVSGNTSDSGSEESWFDPRRGYFNLEGWPSGSRRRPAKALGSQGPRGFESHSLRWSSASRGGRVCEGRMAERLKAHDWKSCG